MRMMNHWMCFDSGVHAVYERPAEAVVVAGAGRDEAFERSRRTH